jgi:hypothetical protein
MAKMNMVSLTEAMRNNPTPAQQHPPASPMTPATGESKPLEGVSRWVQQAGGIKKLLVEVNEILEVINTGKLSNPGQSPKAEAPEGVTKSLPAKGASDAPKFRYTDEPKPETPEPEPEPPEVSHQIDQGGAFGLGVNPQDLEQLRAGLQLVMMMYGPDYPVGELYKLLFGDDENDA